MNDKKTKEAVAQARASLATARISFDELEKLRRASRGPLPSLDALTGLLGAVYESKAVTSVVSSLGLRTRKLPGGGADATARQNGIALRVDAAGLIVSVTLYGDSDDGYSSWSGPLDHGLNMSSTLADVRRALGPPHEVVHEGDQEEVRYRRDCAVIAYVEIDDAIGQVRLRRGSP
jgi:hypothetical protein